MRLNRDSLWEREDRWRREEEEKEDLGLLRELNSRLCKAFLLDATFFLQLEAFCLVERLHLQLET